MTLPRDKIIIQDLLLQVVIGAHKPERSIKQNLILTITLWCDTSKCGASDDVNDTIDYVHVTKSVATYCEQAHHFTIEALAVGVARVCCLGFGVDEVSVRVEKPGAIKLAKAPVVEITRRRDFFNKLDTAKHPPALLEVPSGEEFRLVPINPSHYAYLALGSNLGDRLATISNALDTLRKHGRVLSTAHLYETPPAYVTDQPPFLNTACLFETTLSPPELLTLVQSIETQFGRQRTIRYGPRTLDIDILFYDTTLVNTPNLVIPHPLIQERDFVLGPLLDIAPNIVHPTLFLTMRQLFANLRHADALLPPGTQAHHHTPTLKRVTPIRNKLWHPEDKTYITGVLNVTPDSFTDGGNFTEVSKAVAQAEKLVEQGADIIDVGGQSTRPGASLVSVEEELSRVIPVIKAIREKDQNTPISVDTFSAHVAEQAILAGADMINDVTGGTKDSQMFGVAAKYHVPLVLMYSSPTPQYEELRRADPNKPVPPFIPPISQPPTKQQQQQQQQPASIATTRPVVVEYDLVRETNNFFLRQTTKATLFGVNRWQLIIDPGLGFAKTFDQSRELLQRGKEITTLGYSVLVGPSRKGFIGDSLGLAQTAPQGKERLLGTLACCCAAVMWGVHLVRVHDVEEVFFTVRMADAIHKPKAKR